MWFSGHFCQNSQQTRQLSRSHEGLWTGCQKRSQHNRVTLGSREKRSGVRMPASSQWILLTFKLLMFFLQLTLTFYFLCVCPAVLFTTSVYWCLWFICTFPSSSSFIIKVMFLTTVLVVCAVDPDIPSVTSGGVLSTRQKGVSEFS